MKKVLHFDVDRGDYQCDGAVVWCFDSRFQLMLNKLLKRLGVSNSDSIKVAGGAKSLASPERESDRDFILGQIRTSMRLHGTKRVILMLHSDCGAYGGLRGGFSGDSEAEVVHHHEELRRAAKFLFEAEPGLTVNGYFADFEGVWEVDLDQVETLP